MAVADNISDYLPRKCLWVRFLVLGLYTTANNSSVCVMFVTFFDTCMVSLAALIVWRVNPIFVFFPWLTIACLDGLYLSSALTKVPDGAWFTLTLSSVLAALFILWRFGKEQQWQAEAEDRFPTSHLVAMSKDGKLQLKPKYGGETLSTIKGLGIFFDKGGETTPAIFTEVMVFFHLRPVEAPSVPPEDRYRVSRLAIPNCYRLVVRHGYSDEVISPNLAALVCEQVRNFIVLSAAAPAPAHGPAIVTLTPDEPEESTTTALPTEDSGSTSNRSKERLPSEKDTANDPQSKSESILRDLKMLQEAHDYRVLYIIGKEEMRVRAGTGLVRKTLLYTFLWLRDNTRTKIANLRVPTEKVIEVGFVKDV
jgi:KUP system potassium uptake protein